MTLYTINTGDGIIRTKSTEMAELHAKRGAKVTAKVQA